MVLKQVEKMEFSRLAMSLSVLANIMETWYLSSESWLVANVCSSKEHSEL